MGLTKATPGSQHNSGPRGIGCPSLGKDCQSFTTSMDGKPWVGTLTESGSKWTAKQLRWNLRIIESLELLRMPSDYQFLLVSRWVQTLHLASARLCLWDHWDPALAVESNLLHPAVLCDHFRSAKSTIWPFYHSHIQAKQCEFCEPTSLAYLPSSQPSAWSILVFLGTLGIAWISLDKIAINLV